MLAAVSGGESHLPGALGLNLCIPEGLGWWEPQLKPGQGPLEAQGPAPARAEQPALRT